MITIIDHHNRNQNAAIVASMHAARKKVFVDLMKWNVPHDGAHERDEFDDEHAVYLIVVDAATNAHLASVRLLKTERRHLLGDVFPQLSDAPAPRGQDIRELTRFCLAPGIGRAARLNARNLLVRSFIEYALLTGIRAYTGVAEIGWLSQILSAGWTVRSLGLPVAVDGKLLGAMEISITSATLQNLIPSWRSPAARMRAVEFDLSLAA